MTGSSRPASEQRGSTPNPFLGYFETTCLYSCMIFFNSDFVKSLMYLHYPIAIGTGIAKLPPLF